MVLDELKSCPFCGSKELRIPKEFNFNRDGNLNGKSTNVSCMNCFADGPNLRYKDDVIKSWNERAWDG